MPWRHNDAGDRPQRRCRQHPPPTASNCVNVVRTPPAGSTFPVGTTVVTCTGEDDVPGRPGAIITSTYSSGNLAVPIPDPGSIPPQVISVADAGTVTDVDVRVRINHTWTRTSTSP
ncbi:MAG: hypothetical protein IPF53_22670 [Blastocatellia bacterium]|nr:hypothetical protein [Blastocatellia bacterium]